jgi:hypothetical protein
MKIRFVLAFLYRIAKSCTSWRVSFQGLSGPEKWTDSSDILGAS